MKKFLSLSLGLIMACCFTLPTYAEEAVNCNENESENCLEQATVSETPLLISEDVIAAPAPDDSKTRFQFSETSLKSSEELSGSGFFLGDNVEDRSTTKGISFILGTTLKALGSYDYGVHAGVNVVISGDYENDLFVAGEDVSILEDATLGRDVYLAATTAAISADIPGNLYATGTNLVLEDITISGDVLLSFGNITFGKNVKILGTLSYNNDASISGTVPDCELDIYYNPTSESSPFLSGLISTVLSFCGYTIVLVILVLIAPKWLQKLSAIAKSYDSKKGLIDLGIGFALLIGTPIAAILLIATLVGLPLGLLGLALYIILIYLSTLITGYFIGGLFIKGSDNKGVMIGRGTAGIAILQVISLIPAIGTIVMLASLLMGLGLTIRSLR